MDKWRPEGWKNPHTIELGFDTFEAGADAMLKAVDNAIKEAEFSALEALGIQQLTSEEVLCFISYLKDYLGKRDREC